MAKIGLSGGEKLEAKLKEIAVRVGRKAELRVGFLEGATYPDGTPIAEIAAIQEFGATIKVPERQQTVYRKIDGNGDFLKGGRFVKAAKSNYATEHNVGAYQITIPARPFFRGMVKTESGHWGGDLGKLLKGNDYDVSLSLTLMGVRMKDELQQSIRAFSDPPNAPSTIAKKGFDKPLIDTGDMMRAVDSEVEE